MRPPVHVVSAQMRGQREFAHQRLHRRRAIGRRVLLDLQIALHNQPANVVRPHQRSDLGGRIGIGRRIEERHRKTRHAAGDKVERLLAGNQNQIRHRREFGLRRSAAVRRIPASMAPAWPGRQARETPNARRAVRQIRVGEPLFAGRVEPSADEQRDGDERGQRGHEPSRCGPRARNDRETQAAPP